VFAEAWAHGLPVIGGKVSGVAETVRDGEDGILVDPRDVDDTACAMPHPLDDPSLASLMGERGRRRVETNLSCRAMVERFLRAVLDEADQPR